MTLAEEMYEKFVQKPKEYERKENIERALKYIERAMKEGETECEFDADLSVGFQILPETIDYLRDNGFTVELKLTEGWGQRQIAVVTWPIKEGE